MSTVRQNPIPLGVYWLDVFAPSIGSPNTANGEVYMRAWLLENPSAVQVKNREEKTAGTLTPPPGIFGDLFGTGPFTVAPAPFRFFYVFQVVKSPTNFPFEKLGFPSVVKLGAPEVISPADTRVTSDDTVQKPPPETMLGTLKESLGDAGMLAAGALAVFLGYKLLFDRK